MLGVIISRKSRKDKQHNDQFNVHMLGVIISRKSRKDKQHNDQFNVHMLGVIIRRKSRKDIQHNDQAQNTKSDLQNNKSKSWYHDAQNFTSS